MTIQSRINNGLSKSQIEREARRILRRLCEKSTFLLISPDMDKAAVFKEGPDGKPARLSVVGRVVAQEFLLRDWIRGSVGQKVGRYEITDAGRAALKRILSREQKHGMEEARADFSHDDAAFRDQHAEYEYNYINDENKKKRRHRVNITESPLALLARKRGNDGKPIISHRLVLAGERLREDFEVGQLGPRITQNWERFLVGATKGDFYTPNDRSDTAEAARERLTQALAELGPGLGDIAFRCCCFLEGMEAIEKRLGWSARSGKIVLRLALERLAEFYKIPPDKYDR